MLARLLLGWGLLMPLLAAAQQPDSLARPAETPAPGRDTARAASAADSLPADSVQRKPVRKANGGNGAFDPKPGKAARYSLLFPGLGQIYNRDYWKLPLVYGAIGTTVGLAIHNHKQFKDFDRQFQASVDSTGRGDERLRRIRNSFRDDRDLMIVMGVLAYGLQAIEAFVDAHLHNFTVSDDLSLGIRPRLWLPGGRGGRAAAGVGLQLRFR